MDLDEEREAEIESCFSWNVDFPKSIEQFEDLLEVFKTRSWAAKKNDNDDNTSSSDNDFLMRVMVLEKK